ncbi:tail fiber repeat 2 protein [Rahnella aquatilis HX2]|nr:tail fiber repeat 2 protein [Rahnella aquatilis HX2]
MATYKALLTTAGAAKIVAATAGGTQVKITRMAVGDGGGKLPTPDPKQTKLVNEVYRANLNRLSIDAKNSHYLVAELVIQPDVGGFWMREMGLYDADGVLVAVSNMAESYKPKLEEGSGRLQTLRMVLIVSEIESIALSIDGSTVMATKDYVDDKLSEHEKSRNHPDGTLTAKGFVQLNSSVSSTSETLAATPKAVKAANDNANTRVPSTRKINGKALSADQTLTAADVGALPVIPTVLGATNINTLNLEKIGLYVQSTGASATVANGYPAGSQAAGVLEVMPASWTGGVLQRYTVQNTGMVWTRALNASWNGTDGPWRDWVQVSAVNSVTVPSAILTTTDINTLGFASGAGSAALYAQPKNANATAALHYPQGIAGTLYVTPSAYGCQQMYVTFTGNIWNRGLSADWNGVDGPWKEWVPTYSANNKPTAADVGAWTAAQSAASEKALADEVATAFKIRPNLTATDSPNTLRGSAMFGHYGVPGAAAATTEKGYPMNGFVGVIFVTWGPNATQQIAFNNNGRQFTRAATGAWNGADGPWSAWVEVYSPNNKPTAADVGALPAAGTAAAATKLATARKIAGVAFDGTKDISLNNSSVGLGNVGNFAAVQQGGGVGMQTNKVYIGWTGSKVKIQVDASDMGEVYTTNFPPPQRDSYTKTETNDRFLMRDGATYAGFVSGSVADPYMRHQSSNAVVVLATRDWSDSRFIYDVQRGSQALENAGWATQTVWEAPTGCFMTGLSIRPDLGDSRVMGKYYRALMVRTASGSWRQVGN